MKRLRLQQTGLSVRYKDASAFRRWSIHLPQTKAAIELHRGNPAQAIELLETTIPYDGVGRFWPNYLRGLAYLRLGSAAEAMAEFQKILDHRG